MKKTALLLSPVILLFVMMLTLTACSDEEARPSKVLRVYNWGEYISDGSDDSLDVNAAFEKYCADVLKMDVTVQYSTYASNEDMYAKLSQFNAGEYPYDIVIPSDYMIEKLISEGMLEAFNPKESIENYQYIDDYFKGSSYDPKEHYDPNELYSVPYTYGMIGIIYNTAFVNVDPELGEIEEDVLNESWHLLWNEKYAGKILQFNNPRDAFGTAMYYADINVNTSENSEWDRALELLKAQKPLIQAYVNDEIFNKMETASAWIAPYYAGDFLTMENEDLAFYYPSEGANYFVDAMCILKGTEEIDLAQEYINFMLSPEIAVANAVYIGYASPNTQVYSSDCGADMCEHEWHNTYKEEMGEDAIALLYETTPDMINSEYESKHGTVRYKNFTPETQDYVNELWESLKTEHSTGMWIHITTTVIIVSVFALAIYTTYIKKKRSRDYRLRDRNARLAKK